MTPDLFDILHFARKAHYDSRRKGERNDTALVIMGVCSVMLGAAFIVRGLGRGR